MPHDVVSHLFHLPLPILEKLARPVIVYLVLVILLRVFGKRELAQLNPFDLVVLLSLSNTVQNAIIGDDNSVTGGVIDAGYRGEVQILLTNLTDEAIRLNAGDKIAQMIPIPVLTGPVQQVDELADSTRAAKGFGSSGR